MEDKSSIKHKDDISLLKKSFNKLKDPEVRSHLYVFFICLLIAIFIWLSIKLSKEYQATVKHPVTYINIPQDKLLINEPPKSVSLKVTGKGMELFRMKIGQPDNAIRIDVSEARFRKDGKIYHAELPTVWFLSQVARQSEYYDNLIDIEPDTLFMEFEDLKFRKVPVRQQLTFSLAKQVWLRDSVLVDPDSVVISGRVTAVDTVKEVLTKKKALGKLSDPTDTKVALKKFTTGQLQIEQDSVTVSIPCERYTEAQIDLPVNVIAPDSLHVRTFPQSVKVTYWVSLTDFQRVNKSMFRATATFKNQNNRFLEVSLNRTPSFARIIDVEPAKVEYILLK